MGDADAAAQRVLQTVFGYESFRGPQAEIVAHVCGGHDALVLMPTGGGKSLCFQIPALVREGTAIVVSPLIALMKDQVDALQQSGVAAEFLNSALSFEQARDVETRLSRGALKLLYVAPERLVTPRFLELLQGVQVSLIAIDEAHCVSQWGHDFRPEYLQLAVLSEQHPGVPRIALTATADEATRKEIAEKLELTTARSFISSFDRPNIQYRVVEKDNGFAQLLALIQDEHANDAGIVYCLSRKSVEETAQKLCAKGVRALPYHAGLDAKVREANQERFLRDEGVVMVATVAFGMGIDKPNVRFVAHLDLPKSLEGYYQETGRAGRDGLPATAWMSYGLSDVVAVRRLLTLSDAPEAVKRVEARKLDALLAYAETASCRRQVLLRYFGEARDERCGNCDTCLAPVDTWDATLPAQKLLSAAWRTGNRFGAAHLVDVLLGRGNEKTQALGHDQLKVFGLGQELSERQWRTLARQLVSLGLFETDAQGHGSLMVSAQARPLLKGETTLEVRRTREAPPSRKQARAGKAQASSVLAPEHAPLFERLRSLRTALAREQGVPPYVIFHDATLKQMAELRPRSIEALGRISGVGQVKQGRYGAQFLQVLTADEGGADPATEPLPRGERGAGRTKVG